MWGPGSTLNLSKAKVLNPAPLQSFALTGSSGSHSFPNPKNPEP